MALNLEATADDKAYESAAKVETSEPVTESKPVEASKPEAKAETSKPEPKESDSSGRDDKGRFASQKADDAKVDDEPVVEAEKPAAKQKELPRVAAPKMVKLGALQEERDKRQAAQQVAEQYQHQLEALRTEVERLKNPPKAAPDPSVDPDGWYRWKLEQQDQKIQSFEKETEEQKKFKEQREKVNKRIQDAAAYEVASLTEFKQARPEQYSAYEDAVRHYQETMGRLLPSLGIKDPATINNTINDTLLRAVEDAMAAGENAAERIWNLAGSMGFSGKPSTAKSAAAKQETVEDGANDDQLASTLQAVTDQLGVLADGQKASKATSSGGGKTNKGLTLSELVSMSKGTSLLEETELDKIPLRQAKRKLFGE